MPDHAGLRGLLAALGHGLTATSANRSGGEPILDPAEVAELLAGEDAVVVDGGILPGGPPSTLVAIEGGGLGGSTDREISRRALWNEFGRSTAGECTGPAPRENEA